MVGIFQIYMCVCSLWALRNFNLLLSTQLGVWLTAVAQRRSWKKWKVESINNTVSVNYNLGVQVSAFLPCLAVSELVNRRNEKLSSKINTLFILVCKYLMRNSLEACRKWLAWQPNTYRKLISFWLRRYSKNGESTCDLFFIFCGSSFLKLGQ